MGGLSGPAKARIDEARLERLADTLRRDIATGYVHGVAMRVSLDGEVVFDFREGHADKAAGRPLAPDSVFLTMSVAKLFTGVVALSLVDRGLIRLHSPVAEVIPEFARFGKEEVSLFHLMTQTSGVTSGFPPVGPEVLTDIEAITAFVSSQPLESRPGERVNYSVLVAHSIIAAICLRVDGRGRNFATMLADELFGPLGMNNTSLGPRDDLMDRLCPVRGEHDVPYNGLSGAIHQMLFETTWIRPGGEVPGANCLTTLDDLHRFTEMLRRGGELDGVRILSPAMLRYCTQNFVPSMRNGVWDTSVADRNWQAVPANLGIGFLVRGQGMRAGPFGLLNSPETFGGFGSGSTGAWVDPGYGLAYSFLSTGLIEESHHLERTGRLSDLVISAISA